MPISLTGVLKRQVYRMALSFLKRLLSYLDGLPLSGLISFNLHGSIWPSQHGLQHIEFDSPDAVLEQSISNLSISSRYAVLFGLAGNPDIDRLYRLRVDVRDSTSVVATQEFAFDCNPGPARSDAGWRDERLEFTATESVARFVFSRTDGGEDGWGPDLDNVRLFNIDAGRLVGDYNGNGIVDAADYVVWRKQLGMSG